MNITIFNNASNPNTRPTKSTVSFGFEWYYKSSEFRLQDLHRVISDPEKFQSIKIKKPPKNNQKILISIMKILKTIEYLEIYIKTKPIYN